ncbi:MAG TPA: DUF86 domain-containing protein [Brevundimonas sp.]|jgi:uncharacterized protein with HEPN domain|uniref:HepT-like ribonuclease domain-containing protein n=1 Tax=Brevundimonas sp. TaxID=1871086 RepID=UPI002C4CD5D1|nr:HepT-like ribonuclease domain-containing protein [Brevundimonas sp.]HRH21309.1 DUF86 domain-containing protein [Brevundimonas sp.]
MTPATRSLLQEMIAYGTEARAAVGADGVEEILADRGREHTVLRTLQIVGEAAAQIRKLEPDGLPGITLGPVISVRNVLVHGYAKIRMVEVVAIIRNDMPPLLDAIERLLAETPE